MSSPRVYRRFSNEFKMQIAHAVLKDGKVRQIAKANEVHPEIIPCVRDFKKYRADALASRGRAYTDNAKIAVRERQLGKLVAENRVLKILCGTSRKSPREKRVPFRALASEIQTGTHCSFRALLASVECLSGSKA